MDIKAPNAALSAEPALSSAAGNRRFGFEEMWFQEAQREKLNVPMAACDYSRSVERAASDAVRLTVPSRGRIGRYSLSRTSSTSPPTQSAPLRNEERPYFAPPLHQDRDGIDAGGSM